MAQAYSLTVHSVPTEDVYRDRVRIPAVHRGTISEGSVCKVSVKANSLLVEVRGTRYPEGDSTEPAHVILMDEVTRAKLDVASKNTYQFQIEEVGWIGQLRWAWNASDPTARIAARLGVLGFALGVIGVILGVIAVYK